MSLKKMFFGNSKRRDGRDRFLEKGSVIIDRKRHRIDKSKVDRNALQIVETLQKANFKAYLVGGCVRDLLIGREPKDFDVVTNANPYKLKKMFHRARIIGRRFRIVHIPFGKQIIETATFRALPPENGDEDDLLLRRDNTYGSEKEDAVRRDFTINGLFYDPVREEIIDHIGGYEDLKKKLIRIIGNAHISYQEDPVRMLRALKFQATTDFRLEKQTWKQIVRLGEIISQCSSARIIEEIYKIMRSGVAFKAFFNMVQAGLLKHLVPEVFDHIEETTKTSEDFEKHPFGERLLILDDLTNRGRSFDKSFYLAILFYDLLQDEFQDTPAKDFGLIANQYLQPVCQRMGFSRKDKDMMVRIITIQPRFANVRKRKKRTAERMVYRDYFKPGLDLFEVLCRQQGSGSDDLLYWVDLYKEALPTIQKQKREKDRQRRNKRFSKNRGRPSRDRRSKNNKNQR